MRGLAGKAIAHGDQPSIRRVDDILRVGGLESILAPLTT
jgi:hypothetical protein